MTTPGFLSLSFLPPISNTFIAATAFWDIGMQQQR